MAKNKVDFQQLLLQHGERIGIGIAGVLSLLLVVMSLFMPGRGLFSGSPAEKVKVLEGDTQWVDARLRDPNNLPTEADKPPADSGNKLVALNRVPVESEQWRINAFIPTDTSGDMGRRQPKIYNIEEALVKYKQVRIQSYIFDEGNPPKIYALEGGTGMGGAGGELSRMGSMFGRGGSGGGGGAPPPTGGMPGMGGGRGGFPGGLGVPGLTQVDNEKKDRKVLAVQLTELAKKQNITLAEQPRPLRTAIIAASFPFKKQVEEFQTKLGMRYPSEVLAEPSAEVSRDGQVLPAFRFLGVNLERRELDGDGKPITEFKPVPLTETYKPYIVLTGWRFEPDDPELEPLIRDGLVMPRLMQFHAENLGAGPAGQRGGMGAMGGSLGAEGGAAPPPTGGTEGEAGPGPRGMPAKKEKKEDQYPSLEKELASIKKTLDTLKGKDLTKVALPPPQFRTDDFDVFAPRPAPASAGFGDPSGESGREGMMGGPPPGGFGPRGGMGSMSPRGGMGSMPPRGGMGSMPPRGGMGSMPPRGGMGGFPPPTGGTGEVDGQYFQEVELPEYCLVRLIDITVEPGKTYEYRMQIRMANPNYNRREAASPEYREKKELVSEWSKTPIKVQIDPEMYLYAVDQKEWEQDTNPRARYSGPYTNHTLLFNRQIFLQAHRWLERVTLRNKNPLLFGEWTVAERIPVFRGEYIGRSERVEVPVWRYTREEFVIASDTTTAKRNPGISVYFGFAPDESSQQEALLVDFDLGTHGYRRIVKKTEDKVETRTVSEECALQALIMKPDGRLMLLEGGKDFNDKEREERLKVVRKRIRDVKEQNKPTTGPAGGTGSPFGGDS